MPRFDPFDLIGAYAVPLQRVDLFGPKSYWGRHVDIEHFVFRVRYLLSTDFDEPLAELFAISARDFAILLPGFHRHMAAWLAGLQQNRRFLPQVLELIQSAEGFECPFEYGMAMQASLVAVCATVVLMGDASLAEAMLEANQRLVSSNEESTVGDESRAFVVALTVACLEAHDREWGTEYAVSARREMTEERMRSARGKLTRILAISEILVAGLRVGSTNELRAALAEFNASSIPAPFQAAGVCKPPRLRPFDAQHFDGTRQQSFNDFRREAAYWKSIDRTIPHILVDQFNAAHPPCWFARSRIVHDLTVTTRVREWLAGTQADLFWLNVAIRAADDPFDLLSALEQDLHLRLPVEIIDCIYERLGALITFDASLTEEHAFDLLLRSNSHDAKSKALLEQAGLILRSQCRLENYPMITMPAGWVPRYHDVRFGGPAKVEDNAKRSSTKAVA